jgi:hypothetical protein
MYVKLSFTQDKNIQDIVRILDDVINWTTTTSVTALMSRVGTSYGANLADGLTTSTSDIIRTVTPTTTLTKSHIYGGNLSTGIYKWTLEQTSYDSTSTKYYIQFSGTSISATGMTCTVGNAITGGTMGSSTLPIGTAYRSSTGGGVSLTVSGSTYSAIIQLTTSGQTNIRHVWMYLNDKCLILAFTIATTYSNGWPSVFSDSTSYCGPWIFGQYTRFDYWNKDSNNIIPLTFSDLARAVGVGFGRAEDYTNVSNYYYGAGNPNSIPMLVFNTVNAFPAVTSNWPLVYNAVPNMQWGYKDTSYSDAVTTVNGGSSYIAGSYGKGISNSASERWPSADLSGTSFQLIALSWNLDRYGASGGNISDRSGFYLFNGDYQPGDEFALGGTTWSVWPLWAGYAARIGLAIPKA